MQITSYVGIKKFLFSILMYALFGVMPSTLLANDHSVSLEKMYYQADIVALVNLHVVQYSDDCLPKYWADVVKVFKGNVKVGERIYIGNSIFYKNRGTGNYIVFLNKDLKKIKDQANFEGIDLKSLGYEEACLESLKTRNVWSDSRNSLQYLTIQVKGKNKQDDSSSIIDGVICDKSITLPITIRRYDLSGYPDAKDSENLYVVEQSELVNYLNQLSRANQQKR